MLPVIVPLFLLLVLAMTVLPASSDNQSPKQPAIVQNLATQQVVQSVTLPESFEITI